MWFDVEAAYKEIMGRDLRPETAGEVVRIKPPEVELEPPADAVSPFGLNHREQAICQVVAGGNHTRTMGDTVTHALIDRLIERGRIEVGKGGRLKLADM